LESNFGNAGSSMPNFQTFDKRAIPMKKRPQVTIQAKGTLSFNASAHHLLGEPKAVELLYDREERIIGFRPTEPDGLNAYPMRPVSAGGNFVVAGIAFLKYYDIPFGVPVRYEADFADGVLMVDLKGEGREALSYRGRASQGDERATSRETNGNR
jgi:hypothetical protein